MHPRQETLLTLVNERPGVCFRRLVRQSGIPAGTAAHHLRQLVKREYVWREMFGNRLAHFPGPRPNHGGYVLHMHAKSLDPPVQIVLEWIAYHPGSCQKDIIAAFGHEPRGTTQHRISILVRHGLVTWQWVGRYKHYYVSE